MNTTQTARRKLSFILNGLLLIVVFTSTLGLFGMQSIQTAQAAEAVCSNANTLLCEDWETGYKKWTWSPGITAANNLMCGDQGHLSKCAHALHYGVNSPSGGFGEAYFFAPHSGVIHLRWYLKYSANYKQNCYPGPGGSREGTKVMYIRSTDGVWYNLVGIRPKDCGANQHIGRLYVDPGALHAQFAEGNVASVDIVAGTWYSVEMATYPGTPTGKDGWTKVWVDGVLTHDMKNLNIRNGHSSAINQVWIAPYIGGPTGTHPAQDVLYDDIVASKQYIGPVNATESIISPPQNLHID